MSQASVDAAVFKVRRVAGQASKATVLCHASGGAALSLLQANETKENILKPPFPY